MKKERPTYKIVLKRNDNKDIYELYLAHQIPYLSCRQKILRMFPFRKFPQLSLHQNYSCIDFFLENKVCRSIAKLALTNDVIIKLCRI